MKRMLFVAVGQSNWQGAAKNECGGSKQHYVSKYTGARDPLPGCNNWQQGGSCFPWLIDLAYQRGVALDVLNYAIGGASVYHYTGKVGATVTGGSASTPASVGFMDPIGLSGGSGIPAVGHADFDPFGLLSRTAAAMSARISTGAYDHVVSYWQNGETDAGVSAAGYSAALQSVADYMLAAGAQAHFIALSSKHATATTGQFDDLQTGIADAVSTMSSAGKSVFAGHDLYAYWGSNPPLYPESSGAYVHLTGRGQEVQARLVDAALAANGF